MRADAIFVRDERVKRSACGAVPVVLAAAILAFVLALILGRVRVAPWVGRAIGGGIRVNAAVAARARRRRWRRRGGQHARARKTCRACHIGVFPGRGVAAVGNGARVAVLRVLSAPEPIVDIGTRLDSGAAAGGVREAAQVTLVLGGGARKSLVFECGPRARKRGRGRGRNDKKLRQDCHWE